VWKWIAPAWWGQDQETTQPEITDTAFLLRVEPLQHARSTFSGTSASPVSARRWSALFWSQENGLEEWSFASGSWSYYKRQSPGINGHVAAMVLIGKIVLARVVNEDGTACLLEFRLNSPKAPKVQTGRRYWEEARCVSY